LQVLNVSSLNEQIKYLLEDSFSRVLVEGELSRITFHNSGHIYFTLKDKDSAISCVMFRGNATKLKFRLEEGLKVVIDGAITLYKPRGSYQINCFSIEPSGQGALALAYEQLKQKLSDKGYFNPDIKKQLSKFPSRIALITSATGAALQDMLRVANKRYRAIEIDIYDVLVQGESAASSISHAINTADTKEYDSIVIGRGGGSIEDLWAFNEEIVADSIFRAKTPIISAVGHEIDWVISDFVADVRAATPSMAMEILLPDTNELYQYIDSISNQLTQQISQKLFSLNRELEHLIKLYFQHSIEKQLEQKKQELLEMKEKFYQNIFFKVQNLSKELQNIRLNFPHAINAVLNLKQNQFLNLQNMLKSSNPKLKIKNGFAQISKDKKVINLDNLKLDDTFEVQSDSVYISAKVIKKEVK